MSFIIEKYFGYDARGHYMCWSELWDEKGNELFKDDAIDRCKELSEKEKGKYRIRSMMDGSIAFEIKTS